MACVEGNSRSIIHANLFSICGSSLEVKVRTAVVVFLKILCLVGLLPVVAWSTDVVYQCGEKTEEQPSLGVCDFGDVIELPGLDFDTGSAQLTTKAAAILDRLAAELKLHEALRFEIAGHTDNVGSTANNRRLSRRRASSVRTYLVLKGVDDGRLTSEGYGESSPIADNSSAQGRKRNRRVELRVVDVLKQ